MTPSALSDMLTFVAIADAGSLAGAARRLGRDATVVTKRLQALEARLGVRLMDRTTRSLSLTEAGAGYLARVRGILASLEEAEDEAAAHARGRPRGTLRLALPGSFGRMWVAPLLPAFLAQHPELRIEAEFSNRFVDMVAENFDLAIRLGSLADSRLVARKIGARRRLLCAAPDYLARHGHPATPEALARHACLCFTGFPSHPVWHLGDAAGRKVRVRVSGPLVADDAEALVDAAVQGLGIMMSTDWLVGRELADGRLVQVLPEWTLADEGAIYLVMPSAKGLAAKTRAFADWIAQHFEPRPPWRP